MKFNPWYKIKLSWWNIKKTPIYNEAQRYLMWREQLKKEAESLAFSVENNDETRPAEDAQPPKVCEQPQEEERKYDKKYRVIKRRNGECSVQIMKANSHLSSLPPLWWGYHICKSKEKAIELAKKLQEEYELEQIALEKHQREQEIIEVIEI